MLKWDCICFDLDNTLIDYEKAFELGMKTTFTHFFGNCNIDIDCWFNDFKKSCDSLYVEVEKRICTKLEYKRKRLILPSKAYGIHISHEQSDLFQDYFYSIVHQYTDLFPEVDKLLTNLKDKGKVIGLITNGKRDVQERKIQQSKLINYINEEYIFISENIGYSKPDERIFKKAYVTMNSRKPLYIGDSWELDVVGALDSGWDAIYLNIRKKPYSTKHKPLAVCSGYTDLIQLLEEGRIH